jgi:hypothetical protein
LAGPGRNRFSPISTREKGVAGGGDAAADADLKAALGRSRAGEQQRAEQEREEMFHAEISWF